MFDAMFFHCNILLLRVWYLELEINSFFEVTWNEKKNKTKQKTRPSEHFQNLALQQINNWHMREIWSCNIITIDTWGKFGLATYQ